MSKQLAERQIMTEALRHSEEQSRLIVESPVDIISLKEMKARYWIVTSLPVKMFGYSRSEMLELALLDLVPRTFQFAPSDFIGCDEWIGIYRSCQISKG